MRLAFVETLAELAEPDERIVLLTADLGWGVVERFGDRHPGRLLNVGVAEANMLGIATGLALTGHVPYVYSIATFASMRCYEQARNGPVLHRLPVHIVGIGGGYAYGHAGPTHYALDDLAILRSQPGMTVVAPADPAQTRAAVRALAGLPGPVYLRIGKGGNPEIPGLAGRFALGEPEIVREGSDVVLAACGAIAVEASKAAARLAERGVSAAVAVVAHLPFAPTPALTSLLARFPAALSVEEGFIAGGLGSLCAEAIAREGLRCRLRSCGVDRPADGITGSEAFMRARAGLDAASLARSAADLLGA